MITQHYQPLSALLPSHDETSKHGGSVAGDWTSRALNQVSFLPKQDPEQIASSAPTTFLCAPNDSDADRRVHTDNAHGRAPRRDVPGPCWLAHRDQRDVTLSNTALGFKLAPRLESVVRGRQ